MKQSQTKISFDLSFNSLISSQIVELILWDYFKFPCFYKLSLLKYFFSYRSRDYWSLLNLKSLLNFYKLSSMSYFTIYNFFINFYVKLTHTFLLFDKLNCIFFPDKKIVKLNFELEEELRCEILELNNFKPFYNSSFFLNDASLYFYLEIENIKI